MRLPLLVEREINELWHAASGFELEFAQLQTQFDVFRALKRVTSEFGWRVFMVLRLPYDVLDTTLAALSIICSWPAEMVATYDNMGLLKTSPVVARLKRSIAPFTFDLEAVPAEDAAGVQKSVQELFIRFNMQRGLYVPVHDPNGGRGAIVFSGDRPPATYEEIMRLHMVSTLIYDRMIQLQYAEERPGEELSEREIECLLLTSSGKTSAEIADLLSVSEHSVNHYLNRAAKKLGTVNRTQAVARALRLGIIR